MRFSPEKSLQDTDPLCSLQEWQRLTNAQTLVIEASHGDELAQLHMAKSDLKSQMELQDFSRTDSQWETDIIAGEEKNPDLLQENLDDLKLQLNEGNRSMNNIQRIHRAYGHQPLQERQTAPIWHQVT